MGQISLPSDETINDCLHLCLRGRWDPTAVDSVRELSERVDLDWEAFYQRARNQGLAPLLYATLRNQGLLPAEIEEGARLVYFLNAKHNLIRFRELGVVLDRLATEQVPVIVLKGAALAEAVYKNLAVRPMCDLDLLLRPADVPTVLELLASLGYETSHSEAHPGDSLAYENEVMLRKFGPLDVLLEVHWSLFDSPYYQRTLDLGRFWDATLPCQFEGVPARILGPEAQLIHLCGHLLLHHGGGEDLRLLWLHDVAELIAHYRDQLDWNLLLSWAQDCDLVLPVQQTLNRVEELWPAAVPPSVLARLGALRPSAEEARVFDWLTAAHRPVARRFWADLASLPGWLSRFHYALHSIFPSAAYMQQRYQARWLFVPFYYPYRWFLGLRGLFSRPAP